MTQHTNRASLLVILAIVGGTPAVLAQTAQAPPTPPAPTTADGWAADMELKTNMPLVQGVAGLSQQPGIAKLSALGDFIRADTELKLDAQGKDGKKQQFRDAKSTVTNLKTKERLIFDHVNKIVTNACPEKRKAAGVENIYCGTQISIVQCLEGQGYKNAGAGDVNGHKATLYTKSETHDGQTINVKVYLSQDKKLARFPLLKVSSQAEAPPPKGPVNPFAQALTKALVPEAGKGIEFGFELKNVTFGGVSADLFKDPPGYRRVQRACE